MSKPLISLGPWPHFKPAPDNEDWDNLTRLARNSQAHSTEIALLMKRVYQADPHMKGPDGTPLLTVLLKGWEDITRVAFGKYSQTNPRPVARFPNANENPWDEQGFACSWELPAAALISQGANPFEEGPEGVRPWDVAVQYGAAAVVDQMLRHPLRPGTPKNVDWDALVLRALPWEAKREKYQITHPLPNSFEKSPLVHAILIGHESLGRVIIRHGFPINQPDIHGRTPLFHVSTSRNLKTPSGLIDSLLEAGANPLHEDSFKLTPLEFWSLDIVESHVQEKWIESVVSILKKDRTQTPRAIAACLFANASNSLSKIPNSLSKIPGSPKGNAWKQKSSGAPHGFSWLEWAGLGALARRVKEAATSESSISAMLKPSYQEEEKESRMLARLTKAHLPLGVRENAFIKLLRSENESLDEDIENDPQFLMNAFKVFSEMGNFSDFKDLEKSLERKRKRKQKLHEERKVSPNDFLLAMDALIGCGLPTKFVEETIFKRPFLEALNITAHVLEKHSIASLIERAGWLILDGKNDTIDQRAGRTLTGEALISGLKVGVLLLARARSWSDKEVFNSSVWEDMLNNATREGVGSEVLKTSEIENIQSLSWPEEECPMEIQKALVFTRAWLMQSQLKPAKTALRHRI